jgi:DNA-binding response OmpR family regulator
MSGMILLVEDNERIQANNKAVLERNGYAVRLAMNLAEARKELADATPDAIVLDITLPDGNGLDFLRELRQTSQIPVLLLTAFGAVKDTTAGLDAGGDDYLAKPYNVKELRARVDALTRRAARVPETLTKGRLKADVVAGQAFLDGRDMLLTQKEFSALLLLMQHENETLSAEYIYEKVWRRDMIGDDNPIKVTLSKLRQKLTDSGYVIAAKRGEGYSFEKEE